MSRALRRSLSLWNRPSPPRRLLRSATHHGNETIQIQRVRLRRPFFSRSRLIGATIFTVGTYSLFRWLDEEVEVEEGVGYAVPRSPREVTGEEEEAEGDEVDDDDDDEDEDEDEDEEEDDVLLFLPTGLSRPKPKTFYKGSDPEWKEFVRIAPDRKRLERIQNELVTLVREHMAKNPSAKMRLGKINTSMGHQWLETRFPDGPPVEYERPGIEITDGLTIRKATQPVDPLHHFRLANALFPTVVANSLYADSQKKIARQWQAMKQYIGWDSRAEQKEALTRILTPPVLPSPPPAEAPSPTSPSVSSSVATPAPTNDTQQTSSVPSTSPRQKDDAGANPTLDKFVLPVPAPKDIILDLSTFHQTFRKEFRRELDKVEPPRGSFIVTGLIEVRGTRAKMTLDVAAAYDPKAGKYVKVHLHPRGVTDFRQVPKGGP